MIKQESVCWRISTAVKLSRTHVQRSEQHVINKEQFIHNLSSSWWTYQAQEGFQNRKLLWRTEASLGSMIYHCMLCKNSSMLTHLQSPIYKAVEQFFPRKLKNKKILISSWFLLASDSCLGKQGVCWPKRCHRREVWSEARTLGCVWKQKQSSPPSRNVCQLHTVWPAHWISIKG